MSEFWKSLRNSFFAGLVVVGPVAASVAILFWLFNWVTNFLLPESLRIHENTFLYRLIALAIVLVFVAAVGWVTRLVIGRRLIDSTDALIRRVPLLNRVYGFIKEVSNTMLTGKKTVFQRVVLVPYPKPGMYAIGFVTSETRGEAYARTQSDLINVFLPTSPPTQGYLLMVPRDQLIDLQMSVGEGMKMILSVGAVMPPYPPKSASPETPAV